MYSELVRTTVLGFVLCGASFPISAQSDAGLDQYQLSGPHSHLLAGTGSVGQSVTVGRDGVLSAVEVSLVRAGAPVDELVEIFEYNGGGIGALLGTTTISATDIGSSGSLSSNSVTGTLIPLEHLGIVVSDGQMIAFVISPTHYLASFSLSYGLAIPYDLYPDGHMLVNLSTAPGQDVAFKTFVADPIFADGFELGNTNAWLAR